jgi:Tfp pilus assembly protein PilF
VVDGTAGRDAERLNNWKEIAAFFGRDERTVKRWEQLRGLPVRRVPGGRRGPVYAYRDELAAWLHSHADTAEAAAADAMPAEPSVGAGPVLALAAAAASVSRRRLAVAAAVAVLVAAGLAAALWHPNGTAAPATSRPQARAETLYLNGLYHLEGRQADGLRRAADMFTEAVALDPGYARAYAGLADAYNLLSQYTLLPAAEAYPRARAAAERAITLDPGLADGYTALAFNAFYWQRDFAEAARLFERAIRLEPGKAQAHHWYALATMHERRFDIARREIDAAQRLDPRSPAILANRALILFHAGAADEALAILEPLAASQPNLLSPHAYLATVYLASGRYQDFLRQFRIAARLEGNAARLETADALDAALAAGGGEALLAAWLAEQKRHYADGREPAFDVAQTAALLGDRAAALDYLEAARRRGEPGLLGILLAPGLARLGDEPRYRALVAGLGLGRAVP